MQDVAKLRREVAKLKREFAEFERQYSQAQGEFKELIEVMQARTARAHEIIEVHMLHMGEVHRYRSQRLASEVQSSERAPETLRDAVDRLTTRR
jgi:hypothetical protein